MARPKVQPTGREIMWRDTDIIVSKTDPQGKITYANQIFCDIAGYREEELLGQPHNLIRHPEMPATVFQLLWDTLGSGNEIFAYVVNLARNGDHYWVLAHVTPTFDDNMKIVGYHSSRRVPKREGVELCTGLYKQMCAEEAKYSSKKDGIKKTTEMLLGILAEKGVGYDEFILSV